MNAARADSLREHVAAARRGRRQWSLGVKIRADAAEYARLELVRYAAQQVKPGETILDVGAGHRPHRVYFPHAKYQSCDLANYQRVQHTFWCDAQALPVRDGAYDAALCVHMLDDVPRPQEVVGEIFRILKPGGALYLTAPLVCRVHSAPYHFFNFTCYGLRFLFEKAGFHVEFINPWGGVFWELSHIVKSLPSYIRKQYVGADAVSRVGERRALWRVLRGAALGSLLPFYGAAVLVCRYLIPLTFFYLDRIDRERAHTLGYSCHCRKPME